MGPHKRIGNIVMARRYVRLGGSLWGMDPKGNPGGALPRGVVVLHPIDGWAFMADGSREKHLGSHLRESF